MFITRTRITLATLATGALLFAAGCGDDSESMSGTDHATSSSAAAATSAARTDFDNADVTFLQMMYPHHAQAVEMAKLVPGRTKNPQLLALAAEVEKAQAPEMEQISSLLRSFGKPAPTTGGGHEAHGMPGMMPAEEMSALQAASGAEFDRMWLEMMIEHHAGAIDMAKTELADGVNPDAQALARSVITAQEAEIATMRTMLGQN
ncbi:DUF305 domain-containing protein [Nocardia sp. NPDC050793]|uniref:DUF305 domain-containing protein n=1 Tax=Nocardia sp. NPDC050793 TaxID=3155159 RepID=UPI0033C56D04